MVRINTHYSNVDSVWTDATRIITHHNWTSVDMSLVILCKEGYILEITQDLATLCKIFKKDVRRLSVILFM